MVADTLRDLKVQRIGHGVNAIKDANLVAEIADKGIVLEVRSKNCVMQASRSRYQLMIRHSSAPQ